MSNNKVSTNNVLGKISTTIAVGMDEVVNVFISQYEDKLHSQKNELQSDVKVLNQELEALTNNVSKEHIANVLSVVASQQITNHLFSIEVSISAEPTVNWDKKVIEFGVYTKLKSHTVSDDRYGNHKASSEILVNIPTSALAEYTNLIETKSDKITKLGIVNNEIRDLNRKERAVRGKISQMKLEQSGMQDLLNMPELQLLISSPIQ
jgi:hypothetical protein